jgi:hypothetical protein
MVVPLKEDSGEVGKAALLRRLKSLIDEISRDEGVLPADLLGLLAASDDASLPASLFDNRDLGILETAVKYFHEEEKRPLSEIAKLMNRDRRTIWSTYRFAQKKWPSKLVVGDATHRIPVRVFIRRDLGVLESVTVYLKEERHLRFTDIARILKRDQRTIWTAYNRAKGKNGN